MNLIFLLLFACGDITAEKSSDIGTVDDIPAPSSEINPEDELLEDITVEYSFDDSDSLLYVQVYKNLDAAASGMAHDHVMRATSWSGSVTYNPEDISKCSMGFSLPVQSLQVDEDAMREYVGYEDTISLNDRETIRGHMLASNQLDGENYPDIEFISSGCELVNNNDMLVTGNMAIRGVTKEWKININWHEISCITMPKR